jgi:sensor histidine kinase regulating citrate/malate metabolism
MDYMWHQQQDQYQLTQENIDIINRKCHDLKHQIRALSDMQNGEQKDAFISNIEEAIMIYDASIDTGNKALDTVIMEKSLFCKEHGITLSCIADGTKLDFMDIIDLYTIFGNALDNAIESVDKLEDKEKKVVVVKVFTKDELLMIQVENYLDSELVFQNELPVTTKEEKYFHGFGIKSIQYTVHKYNGCITINTDRRLFQLQILIPLQK